MSKFCTNCGYECSDEAAFCGNCGKPFPAKTETAFEEPAPAPQDFSQQQTSGTYYAPPVPAPQPKKKNGALIAVIIGAAVIIAILLGIIIFGGKDVPPAAEPSYPVEVPAVSEESQSEAPEEDFQAPIFTPVPEEAPSYSGTDPILSGVYFASEVIYDDEAYYAEDFGLSGDITIRTENRTFELYLVIEGETNYVDGDYFFYEQAEELFSYALIVDSEYFGILIYDAELDLYVVQVDGTDIFITFE